MNNLSIDINGELWAAGISATLPWLFAYHDPEKVAPSSALRITKNVGYQAFFGEKLKIDKVRLITLWGVKVNLMQFEGRYLRTTECRFLQ